VIGTFSKTAKGPQTVASERRAKSQRIVDSFERKQIRVADRGQLDATTDIIRTAAAVVHHHWTRLQSTLFMKEPV
jgi:hypothetical protein